MVSSELDALLEHWLASDEQTLALYEGDDAITLKRTAQGILFSVQLSPDKPDGPRLHKYLRQGQSSLVHFQGAVSQAPDTGVLWLLQRLDKNPAMHTLLACLTDLLNLRDTWRAVAESTVQYRPGPLTPSLNSLLQNPSPAQCPTRPSSESFRPK